MDYLNEIILGDCEEVLKDIPDNSVDLIFTSPSVRRPTTKNLRRHSSRRLR